MALLYRLCGCMLCWGWGSRSSVSRQLGEARIHFRLTLTTRLCSERIVGDEGGRGMSRGGRGRVLVELLTIQGMLIRGLELLDLLSLRRCIGRMAGRAHGGGRSAVGGTSGGVRNRRVVRMAGCTRETSVTAFDDLQVAKQQRSRSENAETQAAAATPRRRYSASSSPL